MFIRSDIILAAERSASGPRWAGEGGTCHNLYTKTAGLSCEFTLGCQRIPVYQAIETGYEYH